jgi:hypothetical protein
MKTNKSNVNEGNVYNIQDEISGNKNASTDGLAAWKKETRKQVLQYLKRSQSKNVAAIIKATFGDLLDDV